MTVGKMRGTLAFPDHDADCHAKMAPDRRGTPRCKSDDGDGGCTGGVRVTDRGRMETKSREETNSPDEKKRDTRTRNEHMAP